METKSKYMNRKKISLGSALIGLGAISLLGAACYEAFSKPSSSDENSETAAESAKKQQEQKLATLGFSSIKTTGSGTFCTEEGNVRRQLGASKYSSNSYMFKDSEGNSYHACLPYDPQLQSEPEKNNPIVGLRPLHKPPRPQ